MWYWFPGFGQENFYSSINFHVFHPNCNCNWNIFNKRYPLSEVAFIRRGVLLKLSAYYRGRSKERERLLEYLLCHKKYDFGIWYSFARSKAVLFENLKYCTVFANDKWQASYCMLGPTIWYVFLISYIFFISVTNQP